MELRSFYFHHSQMFLVPIEHLRPEGMSAAYREALLAERDVGEDWIACFERALADYFERIPVLFERDRRTWFPPRLQNVCVVTDPGSTRPYYQPFDKASWLLYVDDFDPARTSRELAVYQLVHAERMWLVRTVQATVLQNLSWFCGWTPQQVEDFRRGVSCCTRPDAAGFAALADALPWVSELHHHTLRPPPADPVEPLAPLPGTQTLVDATQAVAIRGIVDAFEAATSKVVDAYFQAVTRNANGSAPDIVADWLKQQRPDLLVADRSGSLVWDCDTPDDVERVRAAVQDMHHDAARSLCADLEVVSDRTRTFLSAVGGRQRLPSHGEEVEQENGVFLHEDRQLIVYSLEQPGLDTRREPAPPYHRWLVGARTMHEWGHLASDAGLVGLDPDKAEERERHIEALVSVFERIVRNAPPAHQKAVHDDLRLPPGDASVGRALVQMPLQRMQDYMSNLLARELLPVEEMETYVRANVRTLAQEKHGVITRLPRYAYEYQYLRLSRMSDPRHYFYASTWFEQSYVVPGILDTDTADEIFELMGKICGCYRIHPGALAEPPSR